MEKTTNNLNLKPVLYIVVPCFNDSQVLPLTAPMWEQKLMELTHKKVISDKSKVLFINDGSQDQTWTVIKQLSSQNPVFEGISLSRNYGHQGALLAGLMAAKKFCDITISMDSDGQDDIDVIDEMLSKYSEGYEVVYGVRNKRDSDKFFKRTSAVLYYKLLNALSGKVIHNHADCRLVSRRVLEAFNDFREVNLYLRGLFPLVGFKNTCVYYTRHERLVGEGHYTFRKLLTLAMDGITSLSIKPIRMITSLGMIISVLSFLLIIWVFVSYGLGRTIPGWSSSVLAICLIGGIQLVSLGVIGEYIGKIYLETKHRPRYIIAEYTDEKLCVRDHWE